MPLAGRTVLQMDQAAFADQGLLRNIGERCEVTDLDRGVGLRAGRHRQEAPEYLSQPVRDATDLESHDVRENPFGSVAYEKRAAGHS